jgi:hypothetical protein
MPELLKQYEELTTKSNLSKEEKEKLKTVINDIKDMMPGAVSTWGDYGEAIAISTDRVDEFLESQKVLLQYTNKKVIAEQEKDNEKYTAKLEEAKKLQAQGRIIRFEGGNTMFETPKPVLDNRSETLTKLDNDVLEYGNKLKEATILYDQFTGKQLESYVNEARERKRFMAMEKEDLNTWIKNRENATSEYLKIAQEVYNNRFTEPGTSPNDPKVSKAPPKTPASKK